MKYQRVLLDSLLSFRNHISLNKKISRAIGVMHKTKYFDDKRILTTMYYSIIYPFLIYAIPIWGWEAEVYMNNILVLQKSTVRIITGNGRTFNLGVLAPRSLLFLQTSILKIHDIFKLQTAKFVFNCLNKTSSHGYYAYNNNNFNMYATRNKLLFKPMHVWKQLISSCIIIEIISVTCIYKTCKNDKLWSKINQICRGMYL